MKIGMIGMGAVGAVTGKRLLECADCELVCVADHERKARYEKDGIWINGERVNFEFCEPEKLEPCDYVIIATKNTGFETALKQIKKAVGPETVILSLLNGIQSELDLAEAYGEEKVLYGYIVNLSSANSGGKIELGHEGTIVFGEKSNEKSQRVLKLAEIFDRAGILYQIPEDIRLMQWKKFMLNVSCNTVSGLCRAHYDVFNDEITKNLVRMCCREVIAVANKCGIALTEQMAEDNINMTASLNPDGMTSMFQDMSAGRKTENDFFCGTVVKLGKELGIETPVCYLLWQLVKCAELSF